MGCSTSSTKVVAASPTCRAIDAGGTFAFKASRIIAPLELDKSAGPFPALVVVHGFCSESKGVADWTYMQDISEALAQSLGFIVLMIGMPDDDEEHINGLVPDALEGDGISLMAKLTVKPLACMNNAWPAAKYSESLSAAIDHLLVIAPDKLGVQVDAHRIGLVGHSMGGGGVLYGAAKHCKEKIKAVVALNPSHWAVETPFDNTAACIEYGKAPDHSGEQGEGIINHLPDISAPALVYGSLSEYNMADNAISVCPTWPAYENVFAQLTGAVAKELYVDGLTNQSWEQGHCWLVSNAGHLEPPSAYNDGVPLALVCNFLKRHVGGIHEPPLQKPSRDVRAWAGPVD